jgi:hypothetical protein
VAEAGQADRADEADVAGADDGERASFARHVMERTSSRWGPV